MEARSQHEPHIQRADFPAAPAHCRGTARLDVNEWVSLLVAEEDRAPRGLIDECTSRGEVMVEALRDAVEEGRAWKEGNTRGDWWLMLHGAMILGRIASESAGLQLVGLMRRMSTEEDDNLQDWLAGDWAALFENKPPQVINLRSNSSTTARSIGTSAVTALKRSSPARCAKARKR